MSRVCDQGRFLPGIVSPEKKDDRLLAIIEFLDNFISEGLPTLPLMGPRLGFFNGENGIEQKNSLPNPSRKTAFAFRDFHAEIGLYFFKDVLKARGLREKFIWNRETQTDGLTCAMIGILSQQND